MKTLLLLRHAKSDWDAEAGDHARPLAKRGRRAARRVGRFLAVAGPRPDVAVTSSAERARDTLARAARAGGWEDVPAHATEALYDTTPEGVLAVLRALPDEAAMALFVGHEPTLSAMVGRLIGGGAVAMPTATLACIDFDVDRWTDADFGLGMLARLIPVRSLDGLDLKRALKRAEDEGDGK